MTVLEPVFSQEGGPAVHAACATAQSLVLWVVVGTKHCVRGQVAQQTLHLIQLLGEVPDGSR